MEQHKWKSNRLLKVVLAAASVLTATAAICSGLAVIVMADTGVYGTSKEDLLKSKYGHYSDIYLAMAMGSRSRALASEGTLERVGQTNFRYGIIKAEDIAEVDISDPAGYVYYNFEEMPKKDEIEREEVRVDKIVVDEFTRYNWTESLLFGSGLIYREKPEEAEAVAVERKVPITGYYYNVDDGIFYYATEKEFYRVDQVAFPYYVNDTTHMLSFQYDSGQHAYYNTDPEVSPVSEYYVTFDLFDGTEASWQTWQGIYLDGEHFVRKSIRFVNDKNTGTGEFLGKPIADHYYRFYEKGTLIVTETKEEVQAEVPKEAPEEERAVAQAATEEKAVDTAVATETPEIGEIADQTMAAETPETGEITDRAETPETAETAKATLENGTYLVVSKVRNPLQKTGLLGANILPGVPGDLYEQITLVLDYAYAWRYTMIGVLVAAFALWVGTTVPVLVMAGHRGSYETAEAPGEAGAEGGEKTEKRWVDAVKPGLWQKIPLEVETCMIAFAGIVVTAAGTHAYYRNLQHMVGLWLMFFIDYMLCFIWLTDLTVRLKLGRWWRGTLTFLCVSWAGRYGKKAVCFLRENISFLWKGILLLGGVSALELCGIGVTQNNVNAEILLWLLYRGSTVAIILLGMVQAEKLRQGAKNLAAGNLQEKVKTDKMFWEFKKHGKNLNSIGDGINLAVEKRMQSEHFRTELITNVSHDIKTPLTSIVNYVDLLQKEELGNEKAKEYLEVLCRQSARLKKLTEDLIEASKASTGSMSVQMERLELGVFLTQTVGEFEEKLKAAGLRVVMHRPEREIFVDADGRHLSRVVENLVQNICKYAQPDTRVYIDLGGAEREAVISFKNVSRYELNISGAELMERFVRGDASRHTEGSGLGLSIAGSLMELMHGKLEIAVDGDLFKVVLRFYAVSTDR